MAAGSAVPPRALPGKDEANAVNASAFAPVPGGAPRPSVKLRALRIEMAHGEAVLTQGGQIPVVLQHHFFVQVLLLGLQQLPLLLGEVQRYILEDHRFL